MGKKFKLKRPIKNAAETEEIKEVTFKDESEVTASDFYSVSFKADGSSDLGTMADAVANLSGLTLGQVASLDIKDYIKMSAEAGKYIE